MQLKPLFKDTSIIWTSLHHRQFTRSQGNLNGHILYLCCIDNSIIWPLSSSPFVSVLNRFDCTSTCLLLIKRNSDKLWWYGPLDIALYLTHPPPRITIPSLSQLPKFSLFSLGPYHLPSLTCLQVTVPTCS